MDFSGQQTCYTILHLTPAFSSFGEERENYFVGRFTQGGSRHGGIALGYYLPLRWSFELVNTRKFVAVHAAMDAVSTAGVSCSAIFTRIFFNASS